MKIISIKTLLVATLMLAPFMPQQAMAQPSRPKLVVGIAVDQMRWDYLYRFLSEYTGGLRLMLDEGFSCENTMINYIPSTTANGHTSIWTGSVPAISGIAGNNFYDGNRWVYCTDDSSVQSVGTTTTAGRMSPRYEMVTTIGDELKLATDFRSKVVSISLKDRAAILPAGHAADAVFWVDKANGNFISSTYYLKELPQWVRDRNKRNKATTDSLYMTNAGIIATAEMAELAVANERLGQRGETDLLCVSFSSTDKLGHAVGLRDERIHQMYLQLDRSLGELFSFLDGKVGKGNYLVFLSADHGGADNVAFLKNKRIPADIINEAELVKTLDSALVKRFGAPTSTRFVERVFDNKVHFNRETINTLGLELNDVKREAIKELKRNEQLAFVVDLDNVASASIPSIIEEKIINGCNRLRGGDIQLIKQPQNYSSDTEPLGTTHSAWNPYDTHIPFVLMGWNVPHGSTTAETHITDIAATVCAMLHIQMPNGCIGKPVQMR